MSYDLTHGHDKSLGLLMPTHGCPKKESGMMDDD